MLKNINIILGIAVMIGVIYSSHVLTNELGTVEEPTAEQHVFDPGFDTPMPGTEGDQWKEFNDLMGSIQDSTVQEQDESASR
tara:strand:+ start:386 stop:631 length:246 start_codon:yes stop_codon:yes gene_type:complete